MNETTLKPDDLVAPWLSPDDAYEDEPDEYAIQANRPRASAIDRFAQDRGVDFANVSCRRRWLRILTRQESYEGRAMDDARQRWEEEHDGDAPDALDDVPPEWVVDEDDPAWAWCEKTTPGAIACWQLEVISRRPSPPTEESA